MYMYTYGNMHIVHRHTACIQRYVHISYISWDRMGSNLTKDGQVPSNSKASMLDDFGPSCAPSVDFLA